MNKNIIIGVLVALLIVLILMFSFSNSGDVTTGDENGAFVESDDVGDSSEDAVVDSEDVDTDSGTNDLDENVGSQTHTVEVTLFRFAPQSLTIKAGDTVDFVAKDSAGRWVASNVHSVHREYPGSGIEKCGTSEEDQIFDSCKILASGETFSFTFNEKGTWKYHDHKSSGTRGTIVVE